ncbi:MAG: LysR family transcriptional regulator, partial [Niabella sp.]
MRKLNYFLTVANYQNINRAAEFLGVQPSTLTKSIKKQEDEMGTQLFRRHGKGMSLTPEGKVFYEFAMTVQRELEYVH